MVRTIASLASLALAGSALAATKTYQVTGPVLALTDEMIVVQKGKDKWEIARDPSTRLAAGLKVGDKVTIEYRMTATSVEVKPAAPAPATAPKTTHKKPATTKTAPAHP